MDGCLSPKQRRVKLPTWLFRAWMGLRQNSSFPYLYWDRHAALLLWSSWLLGGRGCSLWLGKVGSLLPLFLPGFATMRGPPVDWSHFPFCCVGHVVGNVVKTARPTATEQGRALQKGFQVKAMAKKHLPSLEE